MVLENSGDEPNKADTKKCKVLKEYYTKIKQKKKCHCRAGTGDDDGDGLLVPNPRGRSRSHRPPSRAPGSCPLPQDVVSHARILGDPRDRAIPGFSRP
jgi:hypothetical protein